MAAAITRAIVVVASAKAPGDTNGGGGGRTNVRVMLFGPDTLD
jgi:hypothetical protein